MREKHTHPVERFACTSLSPTVNQADESESDLPDVMSYPNNTLHVLVLDSMAMMWPRVCLKRRDKHSFINSSWQEPQSSGSK